MEPPNIDNLVRMSGRDLTVNVKAWRKLTHGELRTAVNCHAKLIRKAKPGSRITIYTYFGD